MLKSLPVNCTPMILDSGTPPSGGFILTLLSKTGPLGTMFAALNRGSGEDASTSRSPAAEHWPGLAKSTYIHQLEEEITKGEVFSDGMFYPFMRLLSLQA